MSCFKQRFGLVLREQQVDKVERGYIGELLAVAASAQFGVKPLAGIHACGRDVVFPVVLRPQLQCARPTPPVNEEAHRAQPCEGCGAADVYKRQLYPGQPQRNGLLVRAGHEPLREECRQVEMCIRDRILEGDIKGCFDHISHEWLLDNIPMDKVLLRKWLKSGSLISSRRILLAARICAKREANTASSCRIPYPSTWT